MHMKYTNYKVLKEKTFLPLTVLRRYFLFYATERVGEAVITSYKLNCMFVYWQFETIYASMCKSLHIVPLNIRPTGTLETKTNHALHVFIKQTVPQHCKQHMLQKATANMQYLHH